MAHNIQLNKRNPNNKGTQEFSKPQIPRLNISQVIESSQSEGGQIQLISNAAMQNNATSSKSSSAASSKKNNIKRSKRAEKSLLDKQDGSSEETSNDEQSTEGCITRFKKMDKKKAFGDALDFLNFTTKKSRFFLQCIFLVALLPTIVFHTQLRVQFDLWQKEFKEQNNQNNNSDAVFGDEKDIINLSLIYTVIGFFVLVSSTVGTELESKLLSRTLPPLANQFAFSALLPFKGLQMPAYPLQTGNLLLFTVLTFLNVLFLSRKTWIKITVFAITMVYLVIAAIYRSHRMETSIVFTSMYDKESISMLVIDSMPVWYAVHQTFHLMFAFLIISLTARRLSQGQKDKNQIVKTKLDQLYECMGLEQSPYVVSKVVELTQDNNSEANNNVKATPSYSNKHQNEIGYIITYISEGFKSLILDQLNCKLEDLVFRKIEVEKMKVFDEFGSSDDESATLLRKKTFSVAEKYLDCWMGKHVQVSNFKQLIDLENDKQIGPIVQIYEVKSKHQLRLEKQKILDAKKKSLELGIQPMNGIDEQGGNQQALIGSNGSSQRQEQPLLIHDDRMVDDDGGSQASAVQSAHSSTYYGTNSVLGKLFDQLERRYVKIKIKEVVKNGSVYRILSCKRIQQPSEELQASTPVKKNPGESSKDQDRRIDLNTPPITEQEQKSEGYDEQDMMENLTQQLNKKQLNEMNKLQKLVQKLLPEQLNQLSMIQHCAENICFTLQRIFAADKAGNFKSMKFSSLRQPNLEPQPHALSSSKVVVPQIDSTKKLNVSTGAIQSSMRFSKDLQTPNNHPLLPEIQEFATNVLSSAQMLFQTFDTAIMCQKLLQSQLALDCYVQQGGPKRIVREVAKIVSPILIEKQMQVKINCSIDETQELKYIWRIYKSIIYHALLWTFNHSQSKQRIFVDIGLEWAIEGQHCQEQQMQAGGLLCHQSSSKPEEDETIELHKQRFLRTDIFFQGEKEYIGQREYQKAIRRDFTYKLAKILCKSVFGRMVNIIDEHFGVVQIILPIEEEVFDFIDGQNVDTHRLDWNQHNKKLFAVLRRKLYKDLKVAKGNDFTVQSTQNKESSIHQMCSSSVKQYNTNSTIINPDSSSAPEVKLNSSTPPLVSQNSNLFDQPIMQRNSLKLQVKSMNSSGLKKRYNDLAEEELKYQKEPLLSDRNKSNVIREEDKDNDEKSSDQSFRFSELSSKNEACKQKLIENKVKEDKVRQAMEKDKLDMQKQIMDSIMQDEIDDDDDQSNSVPARNKKNNPVTGAKGFRKPAMNQMFDKSESINSKKQANKGGGQINNKPGQLGFRRLNTIREQEEQSEQAESRGVRSSASSAYSSQQQLSNKDKSPPQSESHHVQQEAKIDYLKPPVQQDEASGEADQEEDDFLVTVSSYQMSVDCDDEHIGEAAHNMHDKYYRLLRPEAFVNPLAASKEESKNDQDNESAGDKEVINEGDAKPNASSFRRSEAQNPKLQLLEPPQSLLISDSENNLDSSLPNPFPVLPPQNKALSIVEERNEYENNSRVYKSLASSNKNQCDRGDQSMSSQSAEDSSSNHDSVKCDCEESCLIIDDICYNIIPTKMLIKQLLNINVESCNNGFQGVEKYKADLSKKCCKRYINFIIMDLQMPVMDGMAASQKINDFYAQMLQSDAELPPPKIIAITANKLKDSGKLAHANGIKEILLKPLNSQILKECLKKYLDPELIRRLQN